MKQKTRKATAKRFTITKRGILLRRRTRQGHFNSRESGDETRRKRMDRGVATGDARHVRRALPYLR